MAAAKERDVAVRDAEGRPGFVLESEIPQLIASGGSLETEETLQAEADKQARREGREKLLKQLTDPVHGYLGYQEALARGATLGLSDVALTGALGDEYREGSRQRAASPLSALPELAGAAGAMVGGELLAGPAGGAAGAARATGALGRVAELVTAPGRALGAAGRAGEALGAGGGLVGRLAGRGAAEGALVGAGGEVSAAALEDRDLTVDKLLAAAGHGALMGGGLNVATGGATRLLGAAGKAALGGMSEGKGLGESLADFANRRAAKAAIGNSERYYNEATNYGRNPERINRIGQKLLENGVTREALGDLPRLGRTVEGVLETRGRELRAIADQLDAVGVKVFPSRILKAADEQIAKVRETDLGTFDRIADALEREIAPIRRRAVQGEAYSFSGLWKLRRNFDKTIDHARNPLNPDPAADELGKLRAIFDDALDEATTARPELTAPWLKAKEDFSDFRLVGDAVRKGNVRAEKNRAQSPSDYFTGGVAFLSAVMSGGSALAALATSAAAGLVHKQLREKGPGAIARIADRISKLDERTNKAIAAAVSGRPKDLPELPKRVAPLLAALADGVDQPVRTASDQRERYERTLRLVRDIASPTPSPEAVTRLGNATQSLADDFPELASLLHQRVIAAARALDARAPVPLQRKNPLQQHLEERRVPAGLIAKWLREVDGVDTPESIWHDIAKGRVPREKIEIIKETQPYLWEDWRTRVMRVVAERGEKLSRPQRIRLSLAFDFTGDSSIDPARIAQIQSDYAAMKEAEQAQPSPPSGGADLSTKAADEMKPPTEQSFLATG